jgi:hypothetical protein
MRVNGEARTTAPPIAIMTWRPGQDVVLVGESAEHLLPADPELGEVDRFRRLGVSLIRGELAEETVRPGSVIVPQVLGQRSSQVVLTDELGPGPRARGVGCR